VTEQNLIDVLQSLASIILAGALILHLRGSRR
jgi:hypothetical protein